MGENIKEVYFYQYCYTCKHIKKDDTEYPCDECLHNPTNLNSHKPTNWEAE